MSSASIIVPNNVLLIVSNTYINHRLLLGVLYNALRCVNKSVSLTLFLWIIIFTRLLDVSLLEFCSTLPFVLHNLGVVGIIFPGFRHPIWLQVFIRILLDSLIRFLRSMYQVLEFFSYERAELDVENGLPPLHVPTAVVSCKIRTHVTLLWILTTSPGVAIFLLFYPILEHLHSMKCLVIDFSSPRLATNVGGHIGCGSPITPEKTTRAQGPAWPEICTWHACEYVYAPTLREERWKFASTRLLL